MVCSCGKCDKGGLGSGVLDSAVSVGSGATVQEVVPVVGLQEV